jgi:hypothetical protein
MIAWLTGGKGLPIDLLEEKDFMTYGKEKTTHSLLFLSMREGEPTVKNISPMLQISSFFNYFNTRNASLSSFVRFLTE